MIAVALDGFLRSQAKVPILYAVKMFPFLTKTFPTVVLADGPVDEAERWLKMRFADYVGLVGNEVLPRAGETMRQAQIHAIRSQRGPLELLIDPDPATVAWSIQTGTPALLHVHPNYSRPEFRPDAPGRKTWDEVQAELDRQEELMVADARLKVTDGSGRFE